MPLHRDPPAAPADAAQRRAKSPVVCYPADTLPPYDQAFYDTARAAAKPLAEIIVPPREGRAFEVPAGAFFRIHCTEGPQVGDLNLWNATNLAEHFFSGKTRQLQASHLTTGDRLWSSLPFLRPLATLTADTLGWYGWDEDGAGVHDVLGTRCDPYTNHHLRGEDYDRCCHSNLMRALMAARKLSLIEAEAAVHDVFNVFMCTGFDRHTHKYFMKASPARPGDYLELFAEIDLLAALSTCPGGDCGSSHSDDSTPCYPLRVEILETPPEALTGWHPLGPSSYSGQHGV